MGVTFQDVFQKANGRRETLPFAPNFNSTFSLSYLFEPWDISVSYTGRLVGKMKLPEYPDAKNRSEVFTEQNIRLSKEMAKRFEIFGAVKNLFNYTQDDPLIAPDRPFSEDFATDHVFGPIQERRFLIGINFELQ